MELRAEDEAAFVAEVLRINERFQREVVEAFNVCPYARGARQSGRATREVLLQRDEAVAPTLALIARLEADADSPEVVQVIYPRLALAPREFERFNARVRDARTAAGPERPRYVHAAFHPDFARDQRTPESLVPFFRRAPDPTIQLVRFDAIESVRGGRPQGTQVFDLESFLRGELDAAQTVSVTERITRDNHARVLREGVETFEARYAAIREDRARAYAVFSARD